MFMPVHVRKRGDHLKPATVAHFCLVLLAARDARLVFQLSRMSAFRKTKQISGLGFIGDIDCLVSVSMTTIDNRLRAALNRKSNATVTSNGMSYLNPQLTATLVITSIVTIAGGVMTISTARPTMRQ